MTKAPPVGLRAISSLSHDPRNARTHSPEQIEQIAASINEFGFAVPIAADANGIVRAGNGRLDGVALLLERGQSIRWPDGTPIDNGMIPAVDCSSWSEAQCRAYALADNKIALNAGWDQQILDEELAAIAAMVDGIDMRCLTGFDEAEFTASLARLANMDRQGEDDEVAPPLKPVSALGDIWALGGHRIGCGDSTDADFVVRVLNGNQPNLMVTDPPYGVEYDADWRNRVHRKDGTLVGGLAVGVVMNDDRSDWTEAWQLFQGNIAYVWHAGLHANSVFNSLESAGFGMRAQIIWAKQQFAIGRGDYHFQHEPCWYAVRVGKSGNWCGDRKQTTLWQINKPQRSETGHSTQKPVECMKRPMVNNSKPGDFVYEPFSGSGTTIIAGEMIGRRVLAIELNPAYVDMAVIRWQNFTGQEAVLEGGGTYLETAALRGIKIDDDQSG
jgi:DNA modification methylase